jgi:hypothetical protein
MRDWLIACINYKKKHGKREGRVSKQKKLRRKKAGLINISVPKNIRF